jgi:HJR/Mrr/RecB family endonuclease
MNNEQEYRVGHDYIDDIANSKETDQFVKWMPGIGNSKGIRPAKRKYSNSNDLPAFVVLLTRSVNHKHHNPWDDIIDYNSSKIFYWGDAKFDIRKGYKEFEGNKCLMAIYEKYLEGENSTIPPILHFSKNKKGRITFNGLCIITNVETTWFEDNKKPVKNYRFELTILDEERIRVNWLIDKIHSISDHPYQPESWTSFQKGRIKKLNLFKKTIRNKEAQLPQERSADAHVLESLVKLRPGEFEAVLVELFKELPHINHNITRTRLVKDGGFDFFGEFTLPFPFNYKIQFLGEAKKYQRTNPVGPGLVSRLVARLGRGQYGIFVTTSYYTTQSQQEVFEDGYPVKLYSGLDVVNFFRELKLIDKGEIKKEWINEIIGSKND